MTTSVLRKTAAKTSLPPFWKSSRPLKMKYSKHLAKLEAHRTENSLKELEKEWKEIKQLLEGFTDVSLTALER